MTKLGVNIDHSATLRQARYKGVSADSKIIVEPNPIEIALLAEKGGADSITAHLREDRRHILDSDIIALREKISTKLNMEMSIPNNPPNAAHRDAVRGLDELARVAASIAAQMMIHTQIMTDTNMQVPAILLALSPV